MGSFTCTIIGCGPAGLMAAEILVNAGLRVTMVDRMPSPARKILMAGTRGGLNLTNSEPLDSFLARYRQAAPFLEKAIRAFPPSALRQWCEDLGQPTFEGNGGKIFPKSMKASPLVRAWIKRLEESGVAFVFNHRWTGWNQKNELVFWGPEGAVLTMKPEAVFLALGGASWPQMGSDGLWTTILREKNVRLAPWKPSNCGFGTSFSEIFSNKFAGKPLKPVVLSFGKQSLHGEIMLTQKGIEGGPVYALSASLRDEIETKGFAILKLDLRPALSRDALLQKLSKPRGSQSLSTFLRKAAGLSPEAIGLVQEVAHQKKLALIAPQEIADTLKNLPLRLTSTGPIEKAISCAGGVCFDSVNEDYMLRDLEGVFAAGEMLDFEAPTGGYMLQACFSTSVAAAYGMIRWKNKSP